MHYALRPKAKEDLRQIAAYTFEQWGADQELRYLRMLQRSFESLVEIPTLGRRFDTVTPGLRKRLAGQHLILYFIRDDCVDVVRILHHSMDLPRYRDEFAD
jgi:toxin ParE1/3/4